MSHFGVIKKNKNRQKMKPVAGLLVWTLLLACLQLNNMSLAAVASTFKANPIPDPKVRSQNQTRPHDLAPLNEPAMAQCSAVARSCCSLTLRAILLPAGRSDQCRWQGALYHVDQCTGAHGVLGGWRL